MSAQTKTTATNPPSSNFPVVPLGAMGFAAFVCVTFEMFAVGLISPMASDLGVSEGQIGLLMSVYAGLVAVVTIPLMHATRNLDRRPLFIAATTIFLHAGQRNQDLASSIYVVTFQVGIASGSALGAAAVDRGHLGGTLVITLALSAAALVALAAFSRPKLR